MLKRIDDGELPIPSELDDNVLTSVVECMESDDPRFDTLEAELVRRAETGNYRCLRSIRDRYATCFQFGAITRDQYLECAEPFARAAAECGTQRDRITLAGFLLGKAALLSADSDLSFDAGCEGLLILARMIRDEGRDDLLGSYLMSRSDTSQGARDYIDVMLSLDGFENDPRSEPEVLAKAWRLQPPHETLQ